MRSTAVLIAVGLLSACVQGKGGMQVEDVGEELDDNGQTGSPGGHGGGSSMWPAKSTCEERDCAAELTVLLESELGPVQDFDPIVGARCEVDQGFPDGQRSISPPLCVCTTEYEESFYIGAEPIGCAVRGHTYECLMDHGSIAPCSADEPEICDAACDELEARREADAVTSKQLVIRTAFCEQTYRAEDYPVAECVDAVVEIDRFCYPMSGGSVDWRRWQSCKTDDASIRASSPVPTLHPCEDLGDSVPSTAECVRTCEDASDCERAQGCDFGPDGEGFQDTGRGRCEPCDEDSDCAASQTCEGFECVAD